MKEIEEIKQVYEERYMNRSSELNLREQLLYRKYNSMLINKNCNQSELTCLDLGCGEGDKIIGFASKFKSILAIDLSQNAIDLCHDKFKSSHLRFLCLNGLEVEEKFDVITAFGFSLFNTPDNQEFVGLLNTLIQKNLSKSICNTFIIGSFTDYSGLGKDSWYKHTRSDLNEISKEIEKLTDLKMKIIFPHRHISNYFGWGIHNFFAEVYKLVFKRNRTFFIVLDNG